MKSQQGQALTEYLLSLAAVVIVVITGLHLVMDAVKAQWQTLVFWIIFPGP
jgi:Flp pilus assembly pilin Flp